MSCSPDTGTVGYTQYLGVVTLHVDLSGRYLQGHAHMQDTSRLIQRITIRIPSHGPPLTDTDLCPYFDPPDLGKFASRVRTMNRVYCCTDRKPNSTIEYYWPYRSDVPESGTNGTTITPIVT